MEAVFAHFDLIGEGEGSCTRPASSLTAHIKAEESSVSDLRWYSFRYYKKESVYVCGRKKEKPDESMKEQRIRQRAERCGERGSSRRTCQRSNTALFMSCSRGRTFRPLSARWGITYVNTASPKRSDVWAVGGFLLNQASRSLLGILTAHVNVKILFFWAVLHKRTWHACAYISRPTLQYFDKMLPRTTATIHFSVRPGNGCAPLNLPSSTTVIFVVPFFYSICVFYPLPLWILTLLCHWTLTDIFDLTSAVCHADKTNLVV